MYTMKYTRPTLPVSQLKSTVLIGVVPLRVHFLLRNNSWHTNRKPSTQFSDPQKKAYWDFLQIKRRTLANPMPPRYIFTEIKETFCKAWAKTSRNFTQRKAAIRWTLLLSSVSACAQMTGNFITPSRCPTAKVSFLLILGRREGEGGNWEGYHYSFLPSPMSPMRLGLGWGPFYTAEKMHSPPQLSRWQVTGRHNPTPLQAWEILSQTTVASALPHLQGLGGPCIIYVAQEEWDVNRLRMWNWTKHLGQHHSPTLTPSSPSPRRWQASYGVLHPPPHLGELHCSGAFKEPSLSCPMSKGSSS